MFKFIGLDKFDFGLSAESFLDNVQNIFTKGFSDDSDLISDKSFATQPNGAYNRNNYPSSTGTQRRRLPAQPPVTFSTLFNSAPDKNSSTTSPQASLVRTPTKTAAERIANASFISSNYSSTSPPPNLSRRDSAQSSLHSETRSNHKPSDPSQNHSRTNLPSDQQEADASMDTLSYNSRPLVPKFLMSPSILGNFGAAGFRRPYFFKHTGSSPRDRWLRAYEFVKHQLPNVSRFFFNSQ
ncbi:hypothetical protein BpHYR1_018363 [Brachionus plicatilis]|uniref:Uncharacterized protein n=1 Tax=Brachionus plicatilis TaxID=10195 RepID=A0A3M7PC95_BRAPC|nr:hypothetical protein BpHYR1_018363 [Brachionus plicatilis]